MLREWRAGRPACTDIVEPDEWDLDVRFGEFMADHAAAAIMTPSISSRRMAVAHATLKTPHVREPVRATSHGCPPAHVVACNNIHCFTCRSGCVTAWNRCLAAISRLQRMSRHHCCTTCTKTSKPGGPPRSRRTSVTGGALRHAYLRHRGIQSANHCPESVRWWSRSLAGGNSGLAVLFGALDATYPRRGWTVSAISIWPSLRARRKGAGLPASLFSGSAGLGLAALCLSRPELGQISAHPGGSRRALGGRRRAGGLRRSGCGCRC